MPRPSLGAAFRALPILFLYAKFGVVEYAHDSKKEKLVSVKGLLAAVLAAATLAGCAAKNVVPEPAATRKVTLTGAVPTFMPLAVAPIASGDVLDVAPLVDALNAAWEPLIRNLAKPKTMPWARINIKLIGKGQTIGTECRPEYTMDVAFARGIYCVGPVTRGSSEVYGSILLPEDHFVGEVSRAPGDKKLGVALIVAYFYTLHIRQMLNQGDMIAAPWNEDSQTQWCLTGVGLRALGVFVLPSPIPTLASASPGPEQLPLNLTHIFSDQRPSNDHAAWVLEGFASGSLNSCFI